MKKMVSAKGRSSQRPAGGKSQTTLADIGEHVAHDAPRWTFLTNHAHVLICIHMEPELVLREVAAKVGITERAVQRIVHELEEGGFVVSEKVGRRNHYKVETGRPLRHPIESHRNIGDLLALIAQEA